MQQPSGFPDGFFNSISHQKLKIMPTLFQRVFAYSSNYKLPMLTVNQRSNLGFIMLQKYKISGIQKRYTKVKSKEFDFDGMVIHYPAEFRDEMDVTINDFYNDMPTEPFVYERKQPVHKPKNVISKPEPIPIKKRKVIRKKGELVYSAKIL